ncbi:unnamed protein product, partial [Bubo scandiacus]
EPFKRKAKAAVVHPLPGEIREGRALHTGSPARAGRGCGTRRSGTQHDCVPKQLHIVNRFIMRQSSGR